MLNPSKTSKLTITFILFLGSMLGGAVVQSLQSNAHAGLNDIGYRIATGIERIAVSMERSERNERNDKH